MSRFFSWTTRAFSSSVRLSSGFLPIASISSAARSPITPASATMPRSSSARCVSVPCCASGSVPPACLIATHALARLIEHARAARSITRVEPRLELALAACAARRSAPARARARSRGSPACRASSLRSRAASPNHDTACCSSSSAFARSASLPVFTLSACAAYAMPRSYAARNRSSGSTPALAARLEQRLLGVLELARGEQRRRPRCTSRARRDARRACTRRRSTTSSRSASRRPPRVARAGTDPQRGEQAQRATRARATGSARPGSRATRDRAASRTIGCTWLSMIESRSIARVPAGMYAPSVIERDLAQRRAVELADHRLAVVHQRRLRAGLRIGQRDLAARSRCRGRPRRSSRPHRARLRRFLACTDPDRRRR